MLNEKVLPWFEAEDVPILRILTDRKVECYRTREYHEFELYTTVENKEDTKTHARHPQINGICESFHQTIQNESYASAIRKKVYTSIEELQSDVDNWLIEYNE